MIKVIKFYWPIIMVLFPIIGFSLYLEIVPNLECDFIFDQSTSLLALYQFSYGLPVLVFIASIYTFIFGLSSLKQGQFPPDGFPVLIRKISYGLVAKFFNLTSIVLPVFALLVINLGIKSVDSVTKGRSHAEINEELIQKCSRVN